MAATITISGTVSRLRAEDEAAPGRLSSAYTENSLIRSFLRKDRERGP